MPRHNLLLLLLLLLFSCRPPVYTPKPQGYYHIDLPASHQYQLFDKPGFPYSFEYPTYATIQQDTSFFNEKPENPYWINVVFPELGGQIYISYKVISARQPFGKLVEESYQLSFFHDKKADYIEEQNFHNANGVTGIFYTVTGDAASAYQFMATDTIKHFIRGALYFDTTPNADSLKPVNDFIKIDIQHMLETWRWK
jgi:gliding motility-associated lipoprotein GldD